MNAQEFANHLAGPCPYCGGDVEVDMIDVSTSDEIRFIPGEIRCTWCWEAELHRRDAGPRR